MKTVIDAVNELKAGLGNLKRGHMNAHVNIIHMPEYHGLVGTSTKIVKEIIGVVKLICTVDEFNACVDELSAATWINGISLEEWKAGMKNTVIDSHGNGLEIGKVYEFSDNQTSWNLYLLKGCNNATDDNDYEYEANNCSWRFIRECQSPLGTIKKAPVKPVDGKAYQFDLDGTKKVGVWHDDIGSFFDGFDGTISEICTRSEATRIISLVPENK